MGTTLSLIFRRFATKFSNLVQKKNSPGEGGGGVLLDTGQMLHLVGGALVVNLS